MLFRSYHNAGIVGDFANGYPAFYKGKYHTGSDPFKDPHLQTVLNSEESKKYCEENKDKPVTFLEEDGSFEKWDGNIDFNTILEDLNKDLEKVYKRLEELNVKIKEYEEKYESAKSQRNNKARV